MNYKYEYFLEKYELQEFEGTFKRLFKYITMAKIPKESYSCTYQGKNDNGEVVQITDEFDAFNTRSIQVMLKYSLHEKYNIKVDFLTLIENQPKRKQLCIFLPDTDHFIIEQESALKKFLLEPRSAIFIAQRLFYI